MTKEVTAYISTKDRYFTHLNMCLSSIAMQTYKPKKVIIFDDGEQKDLRTVPVYASLFALFYQKGIEIEVVFGQRKGQVLNHQAAINLSKTQFILRVDDDDVLEANVLEILMENMKDGVGAVGGLVLDPTVPPHDINSASGKIEDIFTHSNVQWCRFNGIKEVDHLNNTFLFRKEAASHGYPLNLSPVGHREETIFTHGIKKNGYKIIVDSRAITWHLRSPTGGIRSYEQSFFWEHDERVFADYLKNNNIKVKTNKLVVLDNGLGDHIAFKMMLPELKKKYDNITLAVCFPEVFEDDNVKLISIAEARNIENIDNHNIYRFMIDNNWKDKTLVDAYRKMLL